MKWYEILFWLVFALFALNKAAGIIDNYFVGYEDDEATTAVSTK